MNWQIIKTLVIKDVVLYARDKFFGLMTIFSIFLYIAFYYLMPKSVNETIEIGFFAPNASDMFSKKIAEEGVIIRNVKTEDELKQAVMEKEYHVGISIPEVTEKSLPSGKRPQVFIYYSSDILDEMKEMYTILIHEMINGMSGYNIAFEPVEIILGPDMGGKQIPYRDRLLPLFVFMLLIMETFGLANLITSEVENGTVQALLTTPMKIVDLFVGKGITGVLLAFTQTMFFLGVTGTLTHNILLIMLAVLSGSIMLTGLAFVVASVSKDMMSVVAWSVLLMLVFAIPAFSVIFPGYISGWIKVIPSFYLVDTLHRAVNFDIGWSGNMTNIMCLNGFNIVFVALGIITLKRKVI